mmetsp:Transcript_40150/g.45698  ORF Transcript_40150/g.45698 Transcript_40150/m.45698 type:complete len:227 (-) Transcript_40150:387-1067(-)|eukprot:CAMPEP_0194146024 /NCGR_PEP_ID=MMETSP0152-20130528/19272_1 /TAXON_ID=1049557 /ORGANISM="Thalassiothrix antarctica, Strain L6-D1" /LENGTH=226 /DNA_ID=CAMNT_0038846423 /DNA_START=61 /DNA_END=741 /DNA_ORIENTATION=-
MHQFIVSITIIACLQCAFHAAAFCLPRSQHASFPKSVAISMFSSGEEEGDALTVTTGDEFEDYSPGQEELASKDTVVGSGETSKPGDVLTVNYKGEVLQTGKVFDEGSFSFKLGVGNVIPGWDLGLKDMQVGGKRTLKIPPTLAYGSRGAGDAIPPNADLKFECELTGLGNGAGAEAMIYVDRFINRFKNPKGAFYAVAIIATFLIPKDSNLGSLFGFLNNVPNSN